MSWIECTKYLRWYHFGCAEADQKEQEKGKPWWLGVPNFGVSLIAKASGREK